MDLSAVSISPDDIAKLGAQDRLELQTFVRNEGQKSSIQAAIHSLTDVCFRKCVTSKISQGKLDKYEEPCMQNCVDRFMDMNNLVLKELDKMRASM